MRCSHSRFFFSFLPFSLSLSLFAAGAGSGTPEVIILDPAGHKSSVPVKLRQIEQDIWRCEYTSKIVGLHSVNIFFCGEPIKGSPFGVKISPMSDSRKVRVRGRGIQTRGIRCGDEPNFFIYTEGAGIGTPEVKIVGPGGINQNVTIKQINDTTYECHYYPTREGRFIIMCKFAKEDIPKSPFEILVGPRKYSSIIAYGPGLRGGVIGYAAAFVVETNGETGALGFSVAGPSQVCILLFCSLSPFFFFDKLWNFHFIRRKSNAMIMVMAQHWSNTIQP